MLRTLGWRPSRIITYAVCDDSSAWAAIKTALGEWLTDGASHESGSIWALLHASVLHRCMPESGNGARGHGWWGCLVLTGIAQLIHWTRRYEDRFRLRMALRCLPPALQDSIWRQSFSGPTWLFAVQFLLEGLQYNGAGVRGCVYMVVDLGTSVWYIGKTAARRQRNAELLGLGVRFREHLSATFRPGGRKATEDRYRTWRRSTPHRMCIIPCVWADGRVLTALEECIIRQAQPPTQKFPGNGRGTRERNRPWPRFRQKPTWATEVRCNNLQAVQSLGDTCRRLWQPWGLWLVRRWAEGDGEAAVRARMYEPKFYDDLLVWLGNRHGRLDWKRLWRHGGTRAACRLWVEARRLPVASRKYARARLERFLRGLVPTSTTYVDVPLTHSGQLPRVRQAVRRSIVTARCWENDIWFARMQVEKLAFRVSKSMDAWANATDHYKASRKPWRSIAHTISAEQAAGFDRRDDCVIISEHCSLPRVAGLDDVLKAVLRQVGDWAGRLGLDGDGKTRITAGLSKELGQFFGNKEADARCEQIAGIRAHALELVTARTHNRHLGPSDIVLVPMDRDTKRRCATTVAGYCHRLVGHFSRCPSVYNPVVDTTVEEAEIQRTESAKNIFGRRIKVKPGLRMPSAYLLPKAKCFMDGSLTWNCTKQHEHDRCIVSAPRDAVSHRLRLAARAIAVVSRAVGLYSTAVARQSHLPHELAEACRALSPGTVPQCEMCGAEKPPLSASKFDAASFFTSCDRHRCHEVVCNIIARLEKKGCTQVLLHRDEAGRDRVSGNHLYDRTRFRACTFDDIRAALRWAADDCTVVVCGLLFVQIAGLPMGSPLSPILARLHLDARHDILYKCPRKIPGLRIFLAALEKRVQSWLQTKCHVDDSIWLSKRICCRCMYLVAEQTWPTDVGITIESEAQEFPFLHCTVRCEGDRLLVTPRIVNELFATGVEPRPRVSSLAVYNRACMGKSHLRVVLAAKLHILLRGFDPADWPGFGHACIVTAMEPLALSWPPRWVADIMCGISYPANRPAVRVCRLLGLWTRHNRHLVAQTVRQQHSLGREYGLGALYDYISEVLHNYRGGDSQQCC